MISVVIPSFNSAGTIAASIQSTLEAKQSLMGLQIIVMDGASTDNTRQICESFGSQIEFVSEPDRGVYDAMNKAISYVKRDWVLFLGSDDFLLPSFVEVEQYLHDPNCCYHGDVILSKNDLRYGGPFSRLQLSLANLCHQSILYSAKVLRENEYNLEYALMADYDLNLRLYSQGVEFQYIPVLVAKYDNVSGMSSTRRDLLFKKRKLRIISELFGGAFALKYLLSAVAVNKIGPRIPILKEKILRV